MTEKVIRLKRGSLITYDITLFDLYALESKEHRKELELNKMYKRHHIVVCLTSGMNNGLFVTTRPNYKDLITSLKEPHFHVAFRKIIYVNPQGKLHFIVCDGFEKPDICKKVHNGTLDFRKQLILDTDKLSDDLTFVLFHDISKVTKKSKDGGLKEKCVEFFYSYTINDNNELIINKEDKNL